ncbi:MAG TPA: class I SAM-dependent methyltransferase [Bacteroidia bacterium]
MQETLDKLDGYAGTYRRSSPYDDYMREYTFREFIPFLDVKKAHALELGCSDGQMTERIARHCVSVDVVDGSARFIEEAKGRNISNATFHHSLFTDYRSEKKYDYIFATYILTHVSDLLLFFEKVRGCMHERSLLFIAVPNTRVLSRQLALHMGLLQDLFSLSENDRNHGHLRAYDRVRLDRDIENNGMGIIAKGGILLKPLADFQMDELIRNQILQPEQMNGLWKLGKEYPELAGVIYSICRKQER